MLTPPFGDSSQRAFRNCAISSGVSSRIGAAKPLSRE
jgi:hypothetical protein